MIECFYDEKGDIQAVIDFLIFNQDNILDDDGELIYVMDLRINQKYKRRKIIEFFIFILNNKFPNLKKAYWFRERKYDNNKVHIFTADKLKNRIKGG